MNMSQLYDKDFYQWTVETANALKNKAFNKLDIEHLQEEIESMGVSQKRELSSRLEVLIMHLLKWQYQPNMRGRSWERTIKEHRRKLKELLGEMPSLKVMIDSRAEYVYKYAKEGAVYETGLNESVFPNNLPYIIDQILDSDFYPT